MNITKFFLNIYDNITDCINHNSKLDIEIRNVRRSLKRSKDKLFDLKSNNNGDYDSYYYDYEYLYLSDKITRIENWLLVLEKRKHENESARIRRMF